MMQYKTINKLMHLIHIINNSIQPVENATKPAAEACSFQTKNQSLGQDKPEPYTL